MKKTRKRKSWVLARKRKFGTQMTRDCANTHFNTHSYGGHMRRSRQNPVHFCVFFFFPSPWTCSEGHNRPCFWLSNTHFEVQRKRGRYRGVFRSKVVMLPAMQRDPSRPFKINPFVRRFFELYTLRSMAKSTIICFIIRIWINNEKIIIYSKYI